MDITISDCIYYLIVAINFVISVRCFRRAGNVIKVVCCLLILTALNELASAVAMYYWDNKYPVYHVYNILELTLYAYYFVLFVFDRPSLSLFFLCFMASAILGVTNIYFFQPIHELNSNMLLVECVLCIFMALYALLVLFKNDNIVSLSHPHAVIWCAILFMMTGTFFFWVTLTLYQAEIKANPLIESILNTVQGIVNIGPYAAMGYAVLISSKKSL